MNTEILTIDHVEPDPAVIQRAADLIRTGRLVAFPTETVYGLGANALDSKAVRSIFAAKGRPSFNPVIVHVADSMQVLNVANEWPETAKRLAEQFWPGPLTIVLPKRPEIPDEVTAGGSTVAVRCPDHPVAIALLRAAKLPIAAPSANKSTELSPTRAEHVRAGLGGRIDLILDGGLCPGGIESTVVDVTGDVVRLLRPGPITAQMLEDVVGKVELGQREGVLRSPGQMARHYSPKTKIRLTRRETLTDEVSEAVQHGLKVGVLTFAGNVVPRANENANEVSYFKLSTDPKLSASLLYDTLHQLDQLYLDLILVEEPPETSEWAAIWDRLSRAAV